MALKIWDGFDHYNVAADFGARSGFLQYVFSPTVPSFVTPGREGSGKALTMSTPAGGGGVGCVFQQRVASAFIGIASYMPNGGSPIVFSFLDSTVEQNQVTVMFRFDNYSITVFRGNAFIGSTIWYGDGGAAGTQLGVTGNNAFVPNAWIFIEIWPVINGSTGSVLVRINNVQILNITGVNTQVSANAWWDKMNLDNTNVFSGLLLWDDLYYGDTTTGSGTYPANSPIGDCHVTTLFPVGNNAVQWTPLTGSNWQEVSETAMDSDTSYNFSSTVGNEDTLNFGSLPSGISVIYGIQLTGAYRKDDSGARQVKQALKSSSTEVYGANWALSETNYVYFTDQWILDPHTSANWNVAGVDALAAGYNVAS